MHSRLPEARGRAGLSIGVCALVLLGLVAVGGAARAGDEMVEQGDPFGLEPAPGRALVYLVNPGSKPVDLFLERTPVARVEKKAFVVIQAAPGKRVLWGTVEGQLLELQPEQTYVFQLHSATWLRQLPVWLRDLVKKEGFRWTPSSAGQRTELAEHLAAGSYPSALRSVGALPLRFERVDCARRAKKRSKLFPKLEVPGLLRSGVLTVDEEFVQYQEPKGSRFDLPVADVWSARVLLNRSNEWTVVISFRRPEQPSEELLCTVSELDYNPILEAVQTVVRRFQRKQQDAERGRSTGTPEPRESTTMSLRPQPRPQPSARLEPRPGSRCTHSGCLRYNRHHETSLRGCGRSRREDSR
jgi:hypothetical protein